MGVNASAAQGFQGPVIDWRFNPVRVPCPVIANGVISGLDWSGPTGTAQIGAEPDSAPKSY